MQTLPLILTSSLPKQKNFTLLVSHQNGKSKWLWQYLQMLHPKTMIIQHNCSLINYTTLPNYNKRGMINKSQKSTINVWFALLIDNHPRLSTNQN